MKTPSLVLLHGYPFDHRMWEKVIACLGNNILAPDLRGFGQTPLGAGEPSLMLMADDVAELLDKNNIPRAIVAGFSMGGYVALAFAERYPDRIAGFGLINSQAAPDSEETRAARRAMIEKVSREGPQVAVAAAIPKLFSSNPASEELATYPVKAGEAAGAAGISWALEAMARRPDRSAVLEKLAVPILLVHSTEDQFIPIARAHALAEKLPEALSIEIDRAGHCSPLEAPELIAQALTELVSRVESQSSQGLGARNVIKHQ